MPAAAQRIGVFGALAALAATAALAGCGGGGGSEEPSAPDPNQVLACVQDAGVRGVATGADEALGTSGGLRLNVAPNDHILVDFFDDPAVARSYSESQGPFIGGSGGNGSSEVVGGTVVVAASSAGIEKQVAVVKGCIG